MDDKDLKIAALEEGFSTRIGELERSSQNTVANLRVENHKLIVELERIRAEFDSFRSSVDAEKNAPDADPTASE